MNENTQTFIGVKAVKATPMNRADYNTYRGWDLPASENGADEGYLVEYLGGEPNCVNHKGYVSWSPKEQFEKAHFPVTLPETYLAMPPHQQRVALELAECFERHTKLVSFLQTPFFGSLPEDEQARLRRQSVIMDELSKVLGQRVANFN